MVFNMDAKILADIIDEIADGLIVSTDPSTGTNYWSNVDTSWNTTNKSENYARRALKYENGAELIYLAIEAINTQTSYWPGHHSRGLRIVFSEGWNSTDHIYTGKIQSTYMPFESHTTTVIEYLENLQVTYYLWVDHTGFVMMAKPEPSGDNQQQSFIICVEHRDVKEYEDGESGFFCYCSGNMWHKLYAGDFPTLNRNRSILRPFIYQWPDFGHRDPTTHPNGNGISFCPMPSYTAYKNIGNGKIYYIKPIINNSANQLDPIFQSELFFMWSENLGLIDGDVIAIQGQPTKFLCKAIDSPDTATRLAYAIKYVG